MSSRSFKPHSYADQKVGRRIKASKKKHTWKFELDGAEQVVEFYESKVSGKRKILVNGDIKMTTKKSGPYETFSVRIGTHNIMIYEEIDGQYELRCDNRSFNAELSRQQGPGTSSYDAFSEQPAKDPFSTHKIPDDSQYITRVKVPVSDGSPSKSPESHSPPKPANISPSNPPPNPPFREEVRAPVQKAPAPQAPAPKGPIDLFESSANFLPDDLFSNPLTSQPYQPPPTQPAPAPVQQSVPTDIFGNPTQPVQNTDPGMNLFDLDNLHIDNYSPALMKKIEEAHKPVSIGADVPNVPMNQLKTEAPPQQGYGMYPMTGMYPMGMPQTGMNPMGMMGMPQTGMQNLAQNPYFTNMMMGQQWSQLGQPNQRS